MFRLIWRINCHTTPKRDGLCNRTNANNNSCNPCWLLSWVLQEETSFINWQLQIGWDYLAYLLQTTLTTLFEVWHGFHLVHRRAPWMLITDRFERQSPAKGMPSVTNRSNADGLCCIAITWPYWLNLRWASAKINGAYYRGLRVTLNSRPVCCMFLCVIDTEEHQN